MESKRRCYHPSNKLKREGMMQNNLDGEESNQRRTLYLNSNCVYTFNNSYTHSNFKKFYTQNFVAKFSPHSTLLAPGRLYLS